MPFPAMPTPIKCPRCGDRFTAEIRTVIDVGDDPELKEAFLRGQVNYAECPGCGSGGTLSAPLVYHDPDKLLLITYVPPELGLSADKQEQYVGSLVQAVMNSLPTEARKGYLLQPKTALTLESMMDMVLEGDGISKELLEAQRAQLRLLTQLLSAVDDDKELDKLVTEHKSRLDYGFFLLLSGLIDASEDEVSIAEQDDLERLREKLLERVTPVMPQAAPASASYEELIGLLQSTDELQVWRRTVALNRGRLDYGFFQTLTGKIEAAESAGETETAEALTALRQRILDELGAQDRYLRQAEDKASLLIMRLSEAPDLRAEVAKHTDELNEAFFAILSRYLEMAESEDDTEREAKLQSIMEATTEALEAKLPPNVRLINRLLRAESEEQTNAVLEQHRGLLNGELLDLFDSYVEQIKEDEEDGELLERLQRTRKQIVAKMTILRA